MSKNNLGYPRLGKLWDTLGYTVPTFHFHFNRLVILQQVGYIGYVQFQCKRGIMLWVLIQIGIILWVLLHEIYFYYKQYLEEEKHPYCSVCYFSIFQVWVWTGRNRSYHMLICIASFACCNFSHGQLHVENYSLNVDSYIKLSNGHQK